MNTTNYFYCEHFAYNLRYYMKEEDISAAKLARIMGINKKTVYRWMDGSQEPRIGQCRIIAGILGIKMSELTGED